MRSQSISRIWRILGQFEQLESRTVLSATISPLPADYEIVSGGELSFVQSAQQTMGNFNDAPPSHEQAHFSGLAHDWHNKPSHPPGQEPGPRGDSNIWQFLVYQYSPQGFTGQSTNQLQPDLQSDFAPPTVPAPLAAKSPPADSASNPVDPPAMSLQMPINDAVWFLSALTTESTSVTVSSLSEESSADSHDTAFQEYWSESILSSNASEWGDEEISEDTDKLTIFEEDEDELLALDELEQGETVDSSLGALECELQAVDSVLAELHEFKFREQETADYKSEGNEDSCPTANNDILTVLLPAESAYLHQQPQIVRTAGGMVLLEPSGDANLSTCNLTAVFSKGLDRVGKMTLGVEVSVGIYQAFDVGEHHSSSNANDPTQKAPAGNTTRLGSANRDGGQSS